MTAVAFRTALPDDLPLFADWAADEGWNPGQTDMAAFRAADPQGLFVAEAGGRPVATISVVNHSAAFAFLGFYICHRDWRGRGIGMGLWQHALRHAGDRTVGLDGVADQQANYRKSGFLRAGATARHQGVLAPTRDPRVRPAGRDDLAAILRLDAEANGVVRPGFMAVWVAATAHRATFVLEEDGAVVGFATARDCRLGVKIGPVIAPDPERALDLARASLAGRQGGPVFLDIPSTGDGFSMLLRTSGFDIVFETARMYRGPAPVVGTALQAIATMELG
jgi:GNAT superfamily N-acetyltransferase